MKKVIPAHVSQIVQVEQKHMNSLGRSQKMRATIPRPIRQSHPGRAAEPLLTPLKLYKAILRAHCRKLPIELRPLGDEYVKAEFKAHKSTENPLYIVGFLTQWQEYLRTIDGGSWQKGKMTKDELDRMSPEQVQQLYELMQETQRLSQQSEKGEHSDK